MSKYKKEANAVVAALKAAGYNVEHIKKSRRANSAKRIDIVKVTIGADVYYVCPLPEITEYGQIFIHTEYKRFSAYRGRIDLYYENGVKCKIILHKSAVEINGVKYCSDDYEIHPHMGHLCGNMYTSYENAWIAYSSLNDGLRNLLTNIERNDLAILDLDFNTKQPIQIDIQNEGFKVVLWKEIRNKDTFTLIDGFITDGLYSESGRDDLFKYVNPIGELTALLVDTQSGGMTLASSTQLVELTDLKDCLIRCENGLYAGFDIKFISKEITFTEAFPEPDDFISECDYDSDSDCDEYAIYRGDFDDYPNDYRNEYGMLWVDDKPVYKYGYTFFTTNRTVELEVRTPNSGKHTKVAF
jgi:hypothetical protein